MSMKLECCIAGCGRVMHTIYFGLGLCKDCWGEILDYSDSGPVTTTPALIEYALTSAHSGGYCPADVPLSESSAADAIRNRRLAGEIVP